MSRKLTPEILNTHKNAANLKLDIYLASLINGNSQDQSKADKICYWIEDWVKFLSFEPNFSPASLRRYKRGEIIKVHLGFNVGSEEGGLHYAVVIDKENPKTSPVVTIIPLTSVKPTADINNLRKGSIYIGTDIYEQLNQKYESEIEKTPEDNEHLERLKSEIQKMKKGSIALVNQITTISKIRIYDSKTDKDILSHIKLPSEKLDLIDTEILKNYTGTVKK